MRSTSRIAKVDESQFDVVSRSAVSADRSGPVKSYPVTDLAETRRIDAMIRRNMAAGVQAKLTVGAPNDKYEQEADRVAEQVMSMPDAMPAVQREELPGEEEELQTKSLGGAIQREAMPEEEEEIQTKPLSATITPLVQREVMPEEEEEIQAKGASGGELEAGGDFESRLGSSKSGGSPLPDDVRSFMEPRFGADFSGVRVHTGSEAVQMNRDVGAQAFAHGQDVYYGAGKGPGKDALTAHELTHVIQQQSTLQRKPSITLLHQSSPVVQRNPAAAAAFIGLTAESWAMAANVVSTIAGVGGAASGVYSAVNRGDNGFGSLSLPQNFMTDSDKAKLQQLAQFKIINAYVASYLSANPQARDQLQARNIPTALTATPPVGGAVNAPGVAAAPSTSSSTGAASDLPTGAPNASAIDQEALTAIKQSVQIELADRLDTVTNSTKNQEFMWGEDDTRGQGLIGQSGSAESVGVTGFLQFHNIQASRINDVLILSPEARNAVRSLPGEGNSVNIRRFIGGSVSGRATWSTWDNLTVNFDPAAQQAIGPDGGAKLIIRSSWYWNRWGPDGHSHMENSLAMTGNDVAITAVYEGTPTD